MLLRSISLKETNKIPAFLLLKPRQTSKSRNHLNALERRLELWERDEIKSLLLQAVTIQKKLTSNNDPKKIADILKKFAKLMGKTNINGLLNLVKNGVLPLGKKTLNSLKQIINGNYF